MNDSGKNPGPVTEDLLGSVTEQAVSDRRRKAGTDVPPKKRMDGTDVPPKKNGWNGCPPKGGMDLLMLERMTPERWNGLAWFRTKGYGKVLSELANTQVAP